MLDRVDIKDAVNPPQKILAQLGLTPVLSDPFNHLKNGDADDKKNNRN